jgi:tetratricopeptide (TPR) repeat protein
MDLLPTLLDLLGLSSTPQVAGIVDRLKGHSLLRERAPPKSILMLNTNELRRWDREGFGLFLDNGTVSFIYDGGRQAIYDLQRDPLEQENLIDDPRMAPCLRRVRHKINSNPYLLRIAAKYDATGQARETAVARHVGEPSLKEIREAIEAEPTNPVHFNNLGTHFARRGDLRRALEAYEQAVTMDPGYLLARKNLIRLYRVGLGDQEMASRHERLYRLSGGAR